VNTLLLIFLLAVVMQISKYIFESSLVYWLAVLTALTDSFVPDVWGMHGSADFDGTCSLEL